MNIDYTKKEGNAAVISLTLKPEDYKPAYNAEIKKQQKSTNLRGFRKGKTPRSMIVKMYGKAILADLVSKKVQESFSDYLEKEKIETLGDPLPIERDGPITIITINRPHVRNAVDNETATALTAGCYHRPVTTKGEEPSHAREEVNILCAN